MDGYQPTHGDHEANLATALDEFEQALTRRWREEICWRLSAGMDDYPRPARAATPPEPAWDYRLYPHWLHIQGHCAYIDWALSGQESDLSAVSCPGYTGAPEELWTDPRSGEQGFVPAHVECGMDRVMLQAADWAYQERQHVSEQLPLFTSHDMRALRSAYDAFVQLGVEHLGMEPEGGAGASHSFRPVDEREIGSKVHLLAGKDGDGGDWWVGWTGLAARRAEAGFFASVAPTLNNQSRIVAALANLYAQRAAIIEKAATTRSARWGGPPNRSTTPSGSHREAARAGSWCRGLAWGSPPSSDGRGRARWWARGSACSGFLASTYPSSRARNTNTI
ncbi:MAG TPA: hypothetical protein VIL37_09040 [Natronosporangium sp.]